ncbi:hypothetical protein F5Y05DRAFT_59644 [Hypoxylon sp. FL0543]|nr:hypothetical protein F5Y05DRAFT_59644 [Hypoxylon sp. FL0543]
MYFLLAALFSQALVRGLSVLPVDDVSEYMTCDIPEIDRLIVISNWTAQRRDGVERFNFRASSTVSDYTAECHGTREDEEGTGWFLCDEPTEDVYVLFNLDGGDWIQVHYRYLCAADDSTDTAPTFGLLSRSLTLYFVRQELDDGYSTTLQEDPLRLNTNARLQAPLPRRDCGEESRDGPRWEVSRFEYTIIPFPGNPLTGTGGGVGHGAAFDVKNSANGYSISCSNFTNTGSEAVVMDPAAAHSCYPSAWIDRDGQYVEWEGYPATTFWFNKTDDMLTLEQTWVCDDDQAGGDSGTFKGTGKAVLPLECQSRSIGGIDCSTGETAIAIDTDESW